MCGGAISVIAVQLNLENQRKAVFKTIGKTAKDTAKAYVFLANKILLIVGVDVSDWV